jgi:hypothetical protein
MALTINPCLSTDAVGRIGNIIFSHSRNGHCVRSWYPPCNPASPSQTAHRRSNFAYAQYLWQNETRAIVDAWIDASRNWVRISKFGHAYTPPARQFYVQCQMNRFAAGLSRIYSPPSSMICNYFPSINVEWDPLGLTAEWSPEIPSECAIIFFQKRLPRPVRYAPQKGVISHVFVHGDTSPKFLSPEAGPTGGPGSQPAFALNSWIHIHARAIDEFGRSTCVLFWPIYVEP